MAKLIEVKKTGKTKNRVTFKATFEGIPLSNEVTEAQQKAGYHPAGYGGPMSIVSVPIGEGKYETTFECFDSCD